MTLFDQAKREHARRRAAATPVPEATAAATTGIKNTRQNTVTVDGQPVPVEAPETVQSGEDNWLAGRGKYGRPRGRDAIEARRISQTAAMETITNGIVDQLVGGELAFESEDDETDGAEAELQLLIRDVLTGPHPMGNDLDDLITAAVADMIGPGNAYWQFLPAEDGSLPVVAMVPLDALTVRHNLDRHGFVPEGEPAYWQAQSAFTGEGMASFGDVKPVPIEAESLAVMHYPRGKRPYQFYPKSPSLQVLEWLEILVNSTTHHNRYYSDNEIPPGLLQILNASNRTVEDVKDKVQAAKGDPRSLEVIGGEGQAMWVPIGDTAVNLNVIEEQKWFFNMCLGSLGLGKSELGFVEDTNRSNGEVEQTRIYKRVAGPFSKQFHRAFVHVCQQFEVYNALDAPFAPVIRFNDPNAERAREQRLREMYRDGGLTLRQYVRRRGDDDLADNEFVVEIDGTPVNYGDYPLWLARELVAEARSTENRPADGDDDETDDGESESDDGVPVVGQASGHPASNGGR